MKKIRSYIGLAMIGGLLVILPLVLFVLAGRWLLSVLSQLISPISDPITNYFGFPVIVSDVLGAATFLIVCVAVGLLVRTAVGRWLHNVFDYWMSKLAPGYKTIRMMVQQLIGGGSSGPLKGEVVLVRLFGADVDTTMTAIVTSKHDDGTVTVYVPTAPVPTSGLTYHVPAGCVEYLDGVSTEEAMRTIIACGAGTADMLKNTKVLSAESTKPVN